MLGIDNEWQQFLQQQTNQDIAFSAHNYVSMNPCTTRTQNKNKTNDNFYDNTYSEEDDDEYDEEDIYTGESDSNTTHEKESEDDNTQEVSGSGPIVAKQPLLSEVNPKGICEELYISTQTKIFFLNQSNLDVQKIFWNTKVIPYSTATNGVIKKQIRFISKTREEFQQYETKRNQELYCTEKIMKQIDNPNARKIKFKDVRKLTVGVSKKDIMNCHGKNKNAFINCFAVILRVQHEEIFHEIHVKVFNTGRMAIPGIVNENLLESTKSLLLSILQPNFDTPIKLISEEESPEVFRLVKGKKNKETNKKEKSHFEKVKAKSNVLINSNFNCGYYIQQEKLRALLRDKYKLNPTYDPSMYPGVKCKFYYNNELPEDPSVQLGHLDEKDIDVTMTELDELTLEKYTKISFMIFRTGNCLIVGNCTKQILSFVYEYVKNILTSEYETIKANQDIPVSKIKKHKPRKKVVQFTQSYYHNLLNIEKSI
jgi:hypothetical protein